MSLFTTFGSFSIAAGILLIFLIFVMLAAERRGELGIARAVGTRRGHLVQMFVFEGLAYDLARRGGRARCSASRSPTGWCSAMAGAFAATRDVDDRLRRASSTSVVIAYAHRRAADARASSRSPPGG